MPGGNQNQRRNAAPRQNAAKLQNALVLFNFFLEEKFRCKDLQALSEHLKDPAMEELNTDKESMLYHEIADRLFASDPQMKGKLLEYDRRIVNYTEEINKLRGSLPVKWKYFQYLSLLFTEMYLDEYFNNKQGFLCDINNYLTRKDGFNSRPGNWHGITKIVEDDLNKLAFWNATGSGKTFLMHINIKQYLYYAEKNHLDIDNIILITPNEDMSAQHKKELDDSNIYAEIFNPNGDNGYFGQQAVQIIDIHKFAEKDGVKSVSIDSFEGKNLVFVDEGHRGQSGNSWIVYRDKLTKDGFAFEYSATFGQAIGALSGTVQKGALITYGKSTLFDYSYKYFYKDGYGKDYRIMNMQNWANQGFLDEYFTAYILMLFEQKKIYFGTQHDLIHKTFLIENPLALFVGAKVSATTSDLNALDPNGNPIQVSDVVYVLQFFNRFTKYSNKGTFAEYIQNLLNGKSKLTDSKGVYIFEHAFEYLKAKHPNPTLNECEDIYDDVLKVIFHCTTPNSQMILEASIKDNEVGMKLGLSNPCFGLVYVGVNKAFIELCTNSGLTVNKLDYGDSTLFEHIDDEDSDVNFLIGSQKFTEGWSCWRVSLMGLMRFGQQEGSQIIQMFGRGIRLKGYKMSLKRSSCLDPSIRPAKIPAYLRTIERLNIFGVKAGYMDMFNDYLKEIGLPTSLGDFEEYEIKTKTDLPQNITLKLIRTNPLYNFKDKETVNPFDSSLLSAIISNKVTVNRYPKIAVNASGNQQAGQNVLNDDFFTKKHLDFLNWTKIYFALERFKNERTWNNLILKRKPLYDLMLRHDWYTLYIPVDGLAFSGDFATKVTEWQEIVIALLKQYITKAYNICKSKHECLHQLPVDLKSSDSNFFKNVYKVQINKVNPLLLPPTQAIETATATGAITSDMDIYPSKVGGILFNQHLFNPVMYLSKTFNNVDPATSENLVKISPVGLNDGEERFLRDLRTFYNADRQKPNGLLKGMELYVLRNASRKGVGFFEASGFYPDFIVWIIKGNLQYVAFIDPKGIMHLKGLDDDKVQLFHKLKVDIRPQINDNNLLLDSYIISDTPYQQVSFWAQRYGKADFKKNHVLFMDDTDYIEKLIKSILGK